MMNAAAQVAQRHCHRLNYFTALPCDTASICKPVLLLLSPPLLPVCGCLPASLPHYCTHTHRTSQRRQANVRVLALQRPLFVALVGAAALYCLIMGKGWLRLLLAVSGGEELQCVCATSVGEAGWRREAAFCMPLEHWLLIAFPAWQSGAAAYVWW